MMPYFAEDMKFMKMRPSNYNYNMAAIMSDNHLYHGVIATTKNSDNDEFYYFISFDRIQVIKFITILIYNVKVIHVVNQNIKNDLKNIEVNYETIDNNNVRIL